MRAGCRNLLPARRLQGMPKPEDRRLEAAPVRGFLTYDNADMIATAQAALVGWTRSRTLRSIANVVAGLTEAPAAPIRLLSGGTTGKTPVRLQPDGC